MAKNYSLTDLYMQFNRLINEKDFRRMRDFMTDDVIMNRFDVTQPGYFEEIGIDAVMTRFELNLSGDSDVQDYFDEIFEKDNKVCAIGKAKGKIWGNGMDRDIVSSGFELRFVHTITFKDNKISYLDYFYDSFTLLSLVGLAVFSENDPIRVEKYLNSLKMAGILKIDK